VQGYFGGDAGIGKHAGLEEEFFVRDVDAHFDDAAGGVELWVDEGDDAVEGFFRDGFDGEGDVLGVAEPWEVLLEGFHF